MSFGAHQSFHIRDGWLRKGLLGIQDNPALFAGRFPEDTLGVGRNMVKSIRFWLPAIGLADKKAEVMDGKRFEKFHPTKFAKMLLEVDPYFEHEETLWLLHYKLATSPKLATTWYWFFNVFGVRQFTGDMFLSHLERYASVLVKSNATTKTFEKDFRCLIRTYSRSQETDKGQSIEESFDCPFAALNLLHAMPQTKSYRIESPQRESLHPLLVAYALVSMQEQELFLKTISLRDALYESCSPGRIFCLESENLYEYVSFLAENYPDIISFGETAGAGLHNINVKKADSFEILESIYEEAVKG